MIDELKIRYKEMAVAKRLAICIAISLTPAAMSYFDEAGIISDAQQVAEDAEKAAAAKLLQADTQLKNLGKTEAQLEFTKDQLKKAETRLPDAVIIDEILRTIGKTSNDSGIIVKFFEPGKEVLKGEEYKYVEVPLKVTIEGRDYAQICEWLDKIAGLKTKMYLKSWNLTRRMSTGKLDFSTPSSPAQKMPTEPSMIAEFLGRKARENLRLQMESEFSLFKLASPAQLAAAEAAEAAKAEKEKKDAPKAPKDADPKKPTAEIKTHSFEGNRGHA